MSRPLAGLCVAALGSVVAPWAVSQPGPNERPPSFAIEDQARAPFQIFDNLYYVGADFVSSYLLTTAEGLIVIDALFESYGEYLLGNVRQLGFDPDAIEYVLVTHAHPDHYRGAAEIASATGAVVGMAADDWPIVEQTRGGAAPARGLVVNDGDTLRLGETQLRFHVTPGHTPGVLSIEFTVYDRGQAHKAFSFGGAGLNSVDTIEAAEDFVTSVRRVLAIDGIEVNVPNHPFLNDLFALAEQLSTRGPNEPHPFVRPAEFYDWVEGLLPEAEQRLRELRD